MTTGGARYAAVAWIHVQRVQYTRPKCRQGAWGVPGRPCLAIRVPSAAGRQDSALAHGASLHPHAVLFSLSLGVGLREPSTQVSCWPVAHAGIRHTAGGGDEAVNDCTDWRGHSLIPSCRGEGAGKRGADEMTENGLQKGALKRTTAQRALLLELIRTADGHLDADELYRRARRRQPGLSLSTVYRNLRLFKELGLVEEHQLDGTRRRYESRSESKHHHLVCLGCGRVVEFKCPSTERMKTYIGRQEGFEVTKTEVRLAGYCRQCRERILSEGEVEARQPTVGRR